MKECIPAGSWEILKLRQLIKNFIEKVLRSFLLQCLVIFLLLPQGFESNAEDTDSSRVGDPQWPHCLTNDYQIVWRDEFTGDVLNLDNWTMPSIKVRDAASLNSDGTIVVEGGLLP
jgi:hypothetical protein